MSKLKEYLLTSLWIAKSEEKNLLIVVYKVIVAYCNGLGVRFFSYYGLVHKSTSSYRDYVHPQEVEAVQREVNRESGRLIAHSKLLFHEKCLEHQLPTPPVLGCLSAAYQSGEAHGVPYIRDASHFMSLVSANSSDTFIFKPNYGRHGHDLLRFSLADSMLCDDHDQSIEPGQLLSSLSADDETYILQPALKHHELVRPIMPGKGLGSVRIVTVNRNGRVSIKFACIKIPTGNSIADNFSAGRAGNLVADIDIASGIIGRCYGPSNAYVNLLELYVRHPDSGAMITGFEFPHWQELVYTVTRAASKLDSFCTVGWDIALCEGGPTLLEANWRYDLVMLQITTRKGLRPELMSLMHPTS
jgi:hypothetical protein